jgi:fibronectin-binding autotransporter adhesin
MAAGACLGLPSIAFANCAIQPDGVTVVCDTSQPNPFTNSINAISSGSGTIIIPTSGAHVNIQSGASLNTTGAAVQVQNNSSVTNAGAINTTFINAYGIWAGDPGNSSSTTTGFGNTLENDGSITTNGSNSVGLFARTFNKTAGNTLINQGAINTYGTISGTSTRASSAGIRSESVVASTITNYGTVAAHGTYATIGTSSVVGIAGDGVEMAGPGTFTNASGASVTSDNAYGFYADGPNANGITVMNAGTLSGKRGAILFGPGQTNNSVILQTGSALSGSLDGGAGGSNNSLIFDGLSANAFGNAIANWQLVALRNNAAVTFTAPSYVLNTLTLEAGSAATFSAPQISISGSVRNDGDLTFASAGNINIAAGIQGAGSLTQNGSGMLTVSGPDTYAGPTTVSGGTLQAGAAGAFSPASIFTVNAGTTLDLGGSNQTVGALSGAGSVALGAGTLTTSGVGASTLFSGVIAGTGGLVKSGAGTFTLSGANSYSGGTTIGAGTLQIGDGDTTGSIAGDVVDNSALVFSRSDNVTYGGIVSGTGTLDQAGAGTLLLIGNQTYTGNTLIDSGTLQLGDGGTSGSVAGDIIDNGALAFNRSDNVTYDGIVSGTGTLTQTGPGTLTLTGDSTYTGDTLISAGTLQLGDAGTTGSVAGDIIDNGALVFDRSDTLTYSGVVSGAGTLTQAGAGTLMLTGDNTYTGNTTVSAGTLQLGNGGTTGSIVGNVLVNGTLALDHSDNLTYDGALSGNGTLLKLGANQLTITGNSSSFTGNTTVSAGTVFLDGTLGGNALVQSGATLGGNGSLIGTTTVAGGGHLAPGDGPDTFYTGNLVLSGGSFLDYQLGLPNIVGGGVNSLTEVAQNLTLAGTLDVTDVGGFGSRQLIAPGVYGLAVYRLIDYGGTLTNDGLAIGLLPTGFNASDMTVQTSVPGQVNLIVNSGGYTLLFWDGTHATANGTVDGGTAIWNTSTTNWTNSAGIVNAPWLAGFAVFEGTAGTVSLGENTTFSGMQFVTDGYRIEGGGFGLNAAGANTLVGVSEGTATIDAPIADGSSGPSRVIKEGDGVLVLGGNNTYSGGTTIADGALQVSSDSNLGAASGDLTFDSGTLTTTGSFTSARDVTLQAAGGTLAPVSGTTLTLTGPIAGPGQLSKSNDGTLVLAGTNTYSGGTLLGGGVLQVSNDANLGAANGALDFEGGTLQLGANVDPSATRVITLGADGGFIDTNGFASTIAQTISGEGALTKLGTGTLTLTADTSYGGGTTIAAGTLQLGNGGTSGSVSGDIVDNGALVFNHSDTTNFGGLISGTGTLTQAGSGTLMLTSDQTYSGGTTIAAGTLQLGDGGAQGSVVGNITDNGTLAINRSDDLTLANTISGSGALTKLGTNTLTLIGNNTYTGVTTISGGVLQVGNGGSSGALVGDTVNNGELQFNRGDSLSYAGNISGSGLVRQAGAGTTILSGASSYTGGTFIDAGTLSVSADNNLGDPAGAVYLNGSTLQLSASFNSDRTLQLDGAGGTIDVTDRNKLSGPIQGLGTLTKTGSGALILNTVASYSGLTHVAAGTLVVGDSAHSDAALAGGGGVVVDAGSAFGGYGQVAGDVENAGTLGVGNALPTLANGPDAQFNITGQLVNTGTITMINGAAGDRLGVGGTYVSNGGSLLTEAVLNQGGAAAQSDILDVHAVTLAGAPTSIVVHSVGGAGAVTTGDGIPLVEVTVPTASATGAFVLSGRVVAGPYEYLLFQGGQADPTDGQWYLRSQAEPTQPTQPSQSTQSTQSPTVGPPIYRPEVGAYLANREMSEGMLLLTLHERQGDPQYASTSADPDGSMGKVWVRVLGDSVRTDAADGLIESTGDLSLFQLGGDIGDWNLTSSDDRLHVGGMYSHGDANADVTAQFNPAEAHGHVDGDAVGAYATWFVNNSQQLGSYLDAWAQYGWFDNDVRSDLLPSVDYHSRDLAVSLEYGYGIGLGASLKVEPQVQVVHMDYHVNQIFDSSDTRIQLPDAGTTEERVGIRVSPQLRANFSLSPFVEADWWHGGGANDISFNGVSLADAVPNNRYQIDAGFQGRMGGGWVLWARAGEEWGSGSYRRSEGQLGLKYSW